MTYLVLDEADRMLDMGFQAQVNSIVNHVRRFAAVGEREARAGGAASGAPGFNA